MQEDQEMPTSISCAPRLLAMLLAGALLGSAPFAAAQDRRGQPPGDHPQVEQRQGEQRQGGQAPSGPGVLRLLPGDSVTQHSIEIAGQKLDYTATTETF